jgi:threonine synthase
VTSSALSHLECSRDGSRHDADVVQGTSPLGAPLLARYDLGRVAETVTREDVAGRAPTL